MDYKNSVVKYFKQKAKEYDLVEDQVYWKLSDKLLWEFLSENVLNNLADNFTFVDAGGGTGRWSKKILDQYKNSKGIIYDLSEDMLQQAREKIEKFQYQDRLQTIQGDLKQITEAVEVNSFDLTFNFHNVLGFVDDPLEVINALSKVVKPGGYVVSLVPNLYHNIFFNIFVHAFDLADEAVTEKRGRFTENMPSMNLFTPDDIIEIYKKCGLDVEIISGFPITIYPGMQETQIRGDSNHVQNILDSDELFNKVYQIEKELFQHKDVASRGNQIFIVGKKKI